MAQLGFGAMIGRLGGNEETVTAYHASIGKRVAAAEIDPRGDGALVLRFTDGSGLKVYDDARSCCESRYITCDDDLSKIIGGKLTGIEQKPGPDETGGYDECHETQFVEVQTDGGSITLTTHNEHNGYYGGFWIVLRQIAAATEAGTATDSEAGMAEGEGATRQGDAQ